MLYRVIGCTGYNLDTEDEQIKLILNTMLLLCNILYILQGFILCDNPSSSFCMCLLPAGTFSLGPSDCQSDVTPLCLWWMENGLTVTIWSVFQMCLVYLVFHPIHLWTCAIIACSDVIIVFHFYYHGSDSERSVIG